MELAGIIFRNRRNFQINLIADAVQLENTGLEINYDGRFGISYKLYGLDSSNSNAFNRCIVLHSYYAVPDYETYPNAICNSLGCPMVSVNFIRKLENKIDSSANPILLWIVN